MKQGSSLIVWRSITQLLLMAAFFLVPLFDILRLDVINKEFYVLGKELSLSQVYLFLVFILFILVFILAISKLLGRVFCGWLCPHNTASEFLNRLESKRFFRKRPVIKGIVIFALAFTISAAAAFGLLSYFITPSLIFYSILELDMNLTFAIFFVIFALLFMLVYKIRHQFCQNACPYGMAQSILADNKTLRVAFVEDRREDCLDCEACTRICHMNLDPRTNQLDTCVNCGDCVLACQLVLSKVKKPSLLTYSFGQNTNESKANRRKLLAGQSSFLLLLLMILGGFLVYGASVYVPYEISVKPIGGKIASLTEQGYIQAYYVEVENHSSKQLNLRMYASEVEEGVALRYPDTFQIPKNGKIDVGLTIQAPELISKGLHSFYLHLQTGDSVQSKRINFTIP
ncbi:4Fe-4S binding protein [Microaerobacter geothermalis]|uniref:4Fe-4S binding protein n=1 Tax=Microaerobacter geothermalis TaxID=674972 RepID=UPI001F3DE7E3|nr:4Fe-4S binding protein [Microaerobacter geothermalis]MCF6093561.1 4Fe-4S binding protein [Microaerobacter geothermalis]